MTMTLSQTEKSSAQRSTRNSPYEHRVIPPVCIDALPGADGQGTAPRVRRVGWLRGRTASAEDLDFIEVRVIRWLRVRPWLGAAGRRITSLVSPLESPVAAARPPSPDR